MNAMIDKIIQYIIRKPGICDQILHLIERAQRYNALSGKLGGFRNNYNLFCIISHIF